MKLIRPTFWALVVLVILGLATFTRADEDTEAEIIDDEAEAEIPDSAEPEISEDLAKEIATGIVDTQNYPGRIISRKKVVSKVPAAGQPLEFEYTIWNVGNSDVTDVELIDNSFSSDDFEVVKSVSIKQAVIKPGESYSEIHSVVPKMSENGIKLSPAKITYKTKTSNDNDELILYSADGATDGLVPLKTAAFYARNVASHYTDWLIFLALVFPSTILPYTNSNNLVAKYTKAKKEA